jgi:hypothetical protein
MHSSSSNPGWRIPGKPGNFENASGILQTLNTFLFQMENTLTDPACPNAHMGACPSCTGSKAHCQG